jgi:hypothetical protein
MGGHFAITLVAVEVGCLDARNIADELVGGNSPQRVTPET